MIEVALIFIFSAHLLLVDLAMAGPLLCAWLEWRPALGDEQQNRGTLRTLAWGCQLGLLTSSALGGLMLGLLAMQNESAYFAGLRRVPADRLWFALAELAFYVACMGAYLYFLRRDARPRVRRLLAVMAATNLMYHFPPFFAGLAKLARQPEIAAGTFGSREFRRLLFDPEVLAHAMHVWIAAVAVSGLALMLLALGRPGRPAPAADHRSSLARFGARLALFATLLQLPVGVWVLLQSPPRFRDLLLGSDLPGSLLLAAAIAMTFALLQNLASLSLTPTGLGRAERNQARRAALWLVLIVVCMVAALRRMQQAGSPLEQTAGPRPAAAALREDAT